MKKPTIRSLALLLCALVLPACEPGSDEGAALEIPFEKYTLENGLEVVLHQDASDPIVALATLVHVGSSREEPGKTGFAHFFEHMSFNDSENVPRGANRKMIGELGGTRNGGTWTDGTVYYEVVPKDAFEKLLWIDSDRLGFMINTVTDWALENEKQVVKNEKRQRVDNQPYGHTRTVIPQILYPPDHPYNWPVIGSLEDLQAATLDDVREFYDRYYGPGNATLAIVGDIDLEKTKQLVEKWFGEIEPGPPVEPLEPRPAALPETRSVYHVDNFAKLPEIRLVFPTVEQFHEDSYALDALASILSEGKRAVLYKTIVEENELAPEAAAFHSADELAGTLTLRVRANEGIDLDEVKAAIDEALARFETDGFLEKDLEQIKAAQETDFYNGISSVLGKAFQLAIYNEFAGDPAFISEDIRRLKAVSRQDVLDVYERYLKDKPYVMTSFVPRGGEELIVDGATRARVVEEEIVPGAEPEIAADPDFEYQRTPTEHDRSEPPLGPAPLLRLPDVWTASTANGLRVLGIAQNELPLVELALRLEGGMELDRAEKIGTATLVARLMTEGTARRTPEELEDAIGLLGANLTMTAGREGITLRANTLARNFEELLDLVEEIVLEPRWDAAEFERLKRELLTEIKQAEGDPNLIAANVFNRRLYGDEHLFGQPLIGTTETVAAITLEDLQAYYRRAFSPAVAAFLVAGDVDRDRVLASLDELGSEWPAREVAFPSHPEPPSRDRPRLYFVDVPGSKQSVLRVGRLAVSGDDPAFNRLTFANNRLGSGSSARLFQLLRIQKGYTYGAYSFIPRARNLAPFVATTSVRANVTLESLELLRDQIAGYGETFTEEDLETTQNLLVKQATRQFETLDDLLGMLEEIATFDLPLDFIEREQREMLALTLDETRRTIDRHLDESGMIYVVVGDGATQLERIAALGYGEPTRLDLHGQPVN